MFINPLEQVFEDDELSVSYTEKYNNKEEFTMQKKHIKTVTVEHHTYSGIMLDPALLLRLLEYATEYSDDVGLRVIVERANKLCYQRGCEYPLGMIDYLALIAALEGAYSMDTIPMVPTEVY